MGYVGVRKNGIHYSASLRYYLKHNDVIYSSNINIL